MQYFIIVCIYYHGFIYHNCFIEFFEFFLLMRKFMEDFIDFINLKFYAVFLIVNNSKAISYQSLVFLHFFVNFEEGLYNFISIIPLFLAF